MRVLPFAFPLAVMLAAGGQAAAQVPGGDAASSDAAARAAEQILTADAARPGDAGLTCEQIGAELQGMFAGMDDMQAMLSSAQRANEEVNKTQADLERRQVTEAPALEAAAMAQTKAAVKMSLNPVAALPEAVAASERMEALNQEQFRKAQQGGRAGNEALQDFKGSAEKLVTNNTDQLTRMRVLTELAEAKDCGPPEGMSDMGEDGDFDFGNDAE